MVGEFGASGSLPAGQPFPAEFAAGFKQVHEVSPDYFTLEQLVGAAPRLPLRRMELRPAGRHQPHPDQPGQVRHQDPGPHRVLRPRPGIQADRLASTTPTRTSPTWARSSTSPQKANQVIDSMKAQIAAVQAKVATLPPVTVFDYDSGTSAPFTGPGLAMPNALITLGGGTNIFAWLKQSWTSVSWEQVVKADPQCIIINDYGTPTAAAEGEVPRDQPDHQEPDRGEEPLLPSPQLRRSHPQPAQRRSRRRDRPLAAPRRLRPPRRRLLGSSAVTRQRRVTAGGYSARGARRLRRMLIRSWVMRAVPAAAMIRAPAMAASSSATAREIRP